MSKAKRRNLYRNRATMPMCQSREDAVLFVVKAVKNKKFNKEAQDTISLFGISGEELSEAGLAWEELKAISSHL